MKKKVFSTYKTVSNMYVTDTVYLCFFFFFPLGYLYHYVTVMFYLNKVVCFYFHSIKYVLCCKSVVVVGCCLLSCHAKYPYFVLIDDGMRNDM